MCAESSSISTADYHGLSTPGYIFLAAPPLRGRDAPERITFRRWAKMAGIKHAEVFPRFFRYRRPVL